MKNKYALINNGDKDENMEVAIDFIEKSKLKIITTNKSQSSISWENLISFSKNYPRFKRIDLKRDEISYDRNSTCKFKDVKLDLDSLALSLNSISDKNVDEIYSKRTFPSAGCMYPTNLYILPKNINGLDNFHSYFYNPKEHCLQKMFEFNEEDLTKIIADENITNYSALIVITSMYFKHSMKYGARGLRYSLIEVGAFAQNLDNKFNLNNIDCCWIGGFDDDLILSLLDIESEFEVESPFLIMAIGKK